jgi:signal peptidase I
MRKRRNALLSLLLACLVGCQGQGDRVLVGKFLYDSKLDPPRRYDVVVFKFPEKPMENGTPKNYIKRLIGLPGEIIAIFFGQLYSFLATSSVPSGIDERDWKHFLDPNFSDALPGENGHDAPAKIDPKDFWKRENVRSNHPVARQLFEAGQFKILRKPPPVALALSRPVYDNNHQAGDLKGVIPPRWAPRAGSDWKAESDHGFVSDGSIGGTSWLHYRHLQRPDDWPAKDSLNRAAVVADIKERQHRPELITDMMGYNTYRLHDMHRDWPRSWAGDLMLELSLTVHEPKGEFWLELSKGVDRFQARFDLANGQCSLFRWSEHKMRDVEAAGIKNQVADWQPLGSAQTKIKARGDYHLRFANYDQRLTLWIDRDMPFDDGKEYPAPAKSGPDTLPGLDKNLDDILNNDLQPASIGSAGASVKVDSIQLWRDTYYTDREPGSLVRGSDWAFPDKWAPLRENNHLQTYYVYPGHYLCLGDNSPESSDSRYWGLVPSRLLLGRALMVYFPFDRAGLIK